MANSPTNATDPSGLIYTRNGDLFFERYKKRLLDYVAWSGLLENIFTVKLALQKLREHDADGLRFKEYDDDGTLKDGTVNERDLFLTKYALSMTGGKATGRWIHLKFTDVNIVPYVAPGGAIQVGGDWPATGFWLSGTSNYLVSGEACVKITEQSGIYRVLVSRETTTWRWRDDIDANSFLESLRNKELVNNPIKAIIEGGIDLTEAATRANFNVDVRLNIARRGVREIFVPKREANK